MTDRNEVLRTLVDTGRHVILIDPEDRGSVIDGVEVASTLEYISDVLFTLHTEPIVEPIVVYVRNHAVLVGTAIQTLLQGLSMYSLTRGLIVAIDTSI